MAEAGAKRSGKACVWAHPRYPVGASGPDYPARITGTFRATFLSGGIVPSLIEPGMRVRHPDRPDWGIGQVQSVVGDRITVNFENSGKVLINAAVINLQIVEEE